jgi:DNA-directed RNA polymerase subunit RPC12/RpoP
MRCLKCGHDAKLKERGDGRCPACSQKFAFEPRSGDPFTDMAFQAAINRVSANGTVKYSEANLFYELTRPRARPWTTGILITLCATMIGTIIGLTQVVPFLVAVGATVGLSLGGARLLMGPVAGWTLPGTSLSVAKYAQVLVDWRTAHGELEGLIELKQLTAGPVPALEAELDSYSFDRAVITDRQETAELLLANNFHFENNCAVLSIDGYPAHAFETVRRMLRKNPRIEVFALHDATVAGCLLAGKLKSDKAWFHEIGRVFDVALRPGQTKGPLRHLRRRANKRVFPDPMLTAAEVSWLAAWYVELAAIRPEQLIKRLFQAMQTMPTSGSTGEGGDSGVILWSTHTTTSDGGGDSFG